MPYKPYNSGLSLPNDGREESSNGVFLEKLGPKVLDRILIWCISLSPWQEDRR
jgi:hypothetical protein